VTAVTRARRELDSSGAERRPGVRAELIGQLALVMALAVVVVVATLGWAHDRALVGVVGRALAAEARAADSLGARVDAETDWWLVQRDGGVVARGPVGAPLDPRTRELARAALLGDGALVDPGPPWAPIRFAMALGNGSVALARMPEEFSHVRRWQPLLVVGSLLLGSLALFAALGGLVLQRRVVEPLERLAAAARELASGESEVSVAPDGPAEAAALAHAFNEMSRALADRNKALEAAVGDLRASNAELRRAQAGLARAERLAVVGRLAAGVAHEVGNPLGAMLAFNEVAGRDPGISEATRELLGKAAAAGERARRILGQLLEYSRPARPARAPFDLAAVARECCDLVRAQRRYRDVALEVEAPADLPLALGDAASAAQILLNLALNAADACAGAELRTVRLQLRPGALHTREGDAPAAAIRARCDAVVCHVQDTGSGIAAEDRERIFDPFFTTKPPGSGTGLGLATAQRLAEEMEGALELSAQAPEGFVSELTLRLPAATPTRESAVRA
jgi:signal transduction histidine kinase